MTMHVCICLCLKYVPLSLARLYASHTGVAVGSGRAAHPGATGSACHNGKVVSISLPLSMSTNLPIYNQDVQAHAKSRCTENGRLRTLGEMARALKQADAIAECRDSNHI